MISLKCARLFVKAKGYHNENHDDNGDDDDDDDKNGVGKTQRPIKNNAHTKI